MTELQKIIASCSAIMLVAAELETIKEASAIMLSTPRVESLEAVFTEKANAAEAALTNISETLNAIYEEAANVVNANTDPSDELIEILTPIVENCF